MIFLVDKKDSHPYNNHCAVYGSALKQEAPTGCGSVWLERLLWEQEVAGSNPVTPIFRRSDARV